MRSVRKWATAGLGAAAVGVLSAAAAWACVAGPSLFTSTINAKAGEEITVTGVDFNRPQPVVLRFNAVDGPVLADLGTPRSNRVEGKVTVPQGTPPGSYVLVATQTGPDGKFTQTPVRAMLNVVGEGAPVVAANTAGVANEARPTGLVTSDNEISGGTLALVGLGVAGVGMFIAGLAALFAGRRTSTPETAKARN
jgi:hypothetical protein